MTINFGTLPPSDPTASENIASRAVPYEEVIARKKALLRELKDERRNVLEWLELFKRPEYSPLVTAFDFEDGETRSQNTASWIMHKFPSEGKAVAGVLSQTKMDKLELVDVDDKFLTFKHQQNPADTPIILRISHYESAKDLRVGPILGRSNRLGQLMYVETRVDDKRKNIPAAAPLAITSVPDQKHLSAPPIDLFAKIRDRYHGRDNILQLVDMDALKADPQQAWEEAIRQLGRTKWKVTGNDDLDDTADVSCRSAPMSPQQVRLIVTGVVAKGLEREPVNIKAIKNNRDGSMTMLLSNACAMWLKEQSPTMQFSNHFISAGHVPAEHGR